MRLESKVKLDVRGKVFGGDKNLACIPMIPATREALVEETKMVAALNPDVIEWRVDYYDKAGDAQYVKESLEEIGQYLNNIPVIFTFRHVCEGGAKEYAQDVRLATIKAALSTGYADIIDIEACNEKEFIDAVKAEVVAAGSKLILSFHNFKDTPSEEFIYNKLIEEKELGADIPKLAVMPKDFLDVMTLMKATYRARTEAVDLPMITMSMGEVGKISRVIGDLYGSDMSFVVGKAASAPGQIPVAIVNELWKLLA
ncbi:type I 3-dehydroquinate dehydratase [Hominifimenecus sp. rT4P-3]|uniref:type I 3-dehydroquinate dehydratase n=1 Tax=Hominifimenecus sp. rT4P-3 TaxID=3242979 RepID=UPI003DA26E33